MTNGGKCLAFKPDDDSLFLVGTEESKTNYVYIKSKHYNQEGDIKLCSVEFSSQFLSTFTAHVTPVIKIAWNPFYHNLFLSCASEYRVLLWHR